MQLWQFLYISCFVCNAICVHHCSVKVCVCISMLRNDTVCTPSFHLLSFSVSPSHSFYFHHSLPPFTQSLSSTLSPSFRLSLSPPLSPSLSPSTPPPSRSLLPPSPLRAACSIIYSTALWLTRREVQKLTVCSDKAVKLGHDQVGFTTDCSPPLFSSPLLSSPPLPSSLSLVSSSSLLPSFFSSPRCFFLV